MEHVEEELQVLKSGRNLHETRFMAIESDRRELKMNGPSLVIDEIERRTLRQCNWIFSGITESMSGSVEERQRHDEEKFGENVGDLGCQDPQSIRILRTGKQRTKRPRLLKAICPNQEVKVKILKKRQESPSFIGS